MIRTSPAFLLLSDLDIVEVELYQEDVQITLMCSSASNTKQHAARSEAMLPCMRVPYLATVHVPIRCNFAAALPLQPRKGTRKEENKRMDGCGVLWNTTHVSLCWYPARMTSG